MIDICTKFLENISKGFRVIEQTRVPAFDFKRGIILSKILGGVTVLAVCTSSNGAPYLY